MPKLKMLRGPEPGRVFELTEDVVTIGRGRKNEIIIHDNEISREHCRLVKVLYDYEVYDLGSTNGTYLNGRQINDVGTSLKNKNIIELGDAIVLEYVASEETPETPSKPLSPVYALTPSNVTANFYLVIRRISQPVPEVYLLDSPVINIGRHLENTICLPETEVSRYHVRLNEVDDGYMLEDLGSVNGTLVNGYRIDGSIMLKPNDYLAIGRMVEMWYTDDLDSLNMTPVRARLDQNDKQITWKKRPMSVNDDPRRRTEEMSTEHKTQLKE
jgi:ABC transport system ATP-binding/permease protein